MLLVGANTPDDTVALIERDFRASARWRREKAVEYPSDKRNLEAAVLLDRLADTVKEIEPSLLAAWRELYDESDIETWNEMIHQVGFYSDSKNATEFVQDFVATVTGG